MDEERIPVRTHQLGGDISTLSVDDLNAYVAALQAEIERVNQAISKRDKTRDAAELFFRK